MKKIKKIIFSPKATLVIFGAAIGLLLFSSIGGAQAALTYFSENHMTEIHTQKIDVALVEGDTLNPQSLLGSLVGANEKLKTGVEYGEKLSVKNTGEIDQYVRVTIYKYWMDGNGKKRDVDPGYINLGVKSGDTWGFPGGWEVDTASSTKERTVIYYTKPLASGESAAFADTFSIASDVASIVTKKNGGGIDYPYQNLTACIEVDVDAVQTHNAEDAILSAWGRRVSGSGGDENGALSSLSYN
mgnify:CR=1 FL=1